MIVDNKLVRKLMNSSHGGWSPIRYSNVFLLHSINIIQTNFIIDKSAWNSIELFSNSSNDVQQPFAITIEETIIGLSGLDDCQFFIRKLSLFDVEKLLSKGFFLFIWDKCFILVISEVPKFRNWKVIYLVNELKHLVSFLGKSFYLLLRILLQIKLIIIISIYHPFPLLISF